MQTTYHNPVWPGYMADPCAIRVGDVYYAYGTDVSGGEAAGKDAFPVLYSEDLAHWKLLGGALKVSPELVHLEHWAPEVAQRDGKFFMYYSRAGATGDETHRLRVAVSDDPAGPFLTVETPILPQEDFTIDAHPFRDPRDGRWYLFFAKDYFDERVGTAVAAVALSDDMLSTVGPVQTILRASADWQIHARNRTIYNRVWDAWHTVEGPHIVYHESRYYLLYSGGAWHTTDYGVGYAVADEVMGPYVEPEAGPVVLKETDMLRGPGHNSVVLGPDNQTLYMVYHAWDPERTARRMCIDPIVWSASGPRCAGPSLEGVITSG